MKRKADLIITNINLPLGNKGKPGNESVAVRDGKVLAAGPTEEVMSEYRSDRIIDEGGRYLFPGFIDAHCHFYGLAQSLRWIGLNGTASCEEMISKVSKAADSIPGEWIVGRGWDQNLWPGKRFPDRKDLDRLFPNRPVVLIRVDGHVLLANGEALKRAGIGPGHPYTSQEVEMKGGWLTGILGENAADHMRSVIPAPEGKELAALLKQAEGICFASGLTVVTDAGLDLKTIRFIESMQKSGELKIHVAVMLNPTRENIDTFMVRGPVRSDRLSITSVKLYADGSLGSRTALLKKPYSDDPSKMGVLVTSPDSIRAICTLAKKYGYQVNTHCIGDSAVSLVLAIYSEFLEGKNDLRWRIEHAQVVDPADFHRFGDISVIPSVQATHATSDMYWAGERLGPDRLKGAYAYRQLMEQNGWIANGTDFPIENVSPLLTFYAATSRMDLKGYPPGGFQKENALSRQEALSSMTAWAAKSNFLEDDYGSLEPGKWADFVILGQDIMSVPLSGIPGTEVYATFCHGERVYGK